jgi:hypothetical protein
MRLYLNFNTIYQNCPLQEKSKITINNIVGILYTYQHESKKWF